MHRFGNEFAAGSGESVRVAFAWAWRILATFACLACTVPGLAFAAGIEIRVADHRGRAVADAVVIMQGASLRSHGEPAPVIHYVDQRNETFIPYVQVVRPGDTVIFRNSDRTRHHVYSFSDIKSFQYLVRAGHQSPPVELDEPGIVAVGCNIHDHMIMYLFVSSAPRIAVSNHAGSTNFADLHPGTYAIEVWHPRVRPGEPTVSQQVTVDDTIGTTTVEFTLSLLPDRRLMADREHPGY